MKQLIILSITVLISVYSVSQRRCQLQTLPENSKNELNEFWKTFGESVSQRDTFKLLSLCEFPFRVTAEILSNKRDIGESYKLDAENISKYLSLLFFEKQFENSLLISTNPMDNLKFHGDLGKKHWTCVYEYFYLVKDKEGKDQIRSFSIVRIDSKYKFVSNWIRY